MQTVSTQSALTNCSLLDTGFLVAQRPCNIAQKRPLRNIRSRSLTRLAMSAASFPHSSVAGAATVEASAAAAAHKVAAQAALDLQERGWTSIEGVVSREECEQYVDDVWRWLESLGTGIKR